MPYVLKDGTCLDGEVNFGHDSECSYLMVQAAEFLGDKELYQKIESIVSRMMEQVYQEGLDPVRGGMYYLADKKQETKQE